MIRDWLSISRSPVTFVYGTWPAMTKICIVALSHYLQNNVASLVGYIYANIKYDNLDTKADSQLCRNNHTGTEVFANFYCNRFLSPFLVRFMLIFNWFWELAYFSSIWAFWSCKCSLLRQHALPLPTTFPAGHEIEV